MQKLSLLPLLLVTGIGAVWASTLMFPNTTEFPRSPGGAGTISGALVFFDPTDGTATNTDKLNGVTASGYLQNRDCSTEVINKIWVGVDASGRAICGTRGVLIGYLDEGSSVSITRGASPSTTISVGDPLYAGDIIQTNLSGTGTIRFAADESILRLDTSTVVELSVGTLGTNSVAQAILSDGRLWGRILTSTGVNLGGGGLVAGVRGTSVSIERPGTTGPYVISVIDSVNHGTTVDTAAATLSPILGYNVGGLSPGSILTAGSQLSVNMIDTAGTMNYSSVIPLSPSTKTSLLTNSAWIRDNTRADIDYLYIHSGSTQRIVDEYNATVPRSIDTLISDALCPEPAGTIPTVKKVYWISLIPYTIYLDKCRESTLLAFASYTGSTTNATNLTLGVASPLILSGSTIRAGGTGSITLEGYSITATGQYISYVTGEFDRIGGLAGKTITIELGGAIPITPTTTKHYVLDFGSALQIYKKGTTWICSIPSGVCPTGTFIESGTFITIKLPNIFTPAQMVIGNTTTLINNLQYQLPLGTNIKNIRIQ